MKLPLLQAIGTNLLLFQAATTTTASPTDMGVEKRQYLPVEFKYPKQDGPQGGPTWECWYKKKAFRNEYHLQGRNWNMTEEDVKGGCKKSDALTSWDWEGWTDPQGGRMFIARFNLPLRTAKRLEHNLDNLLEPAKYKYHTLGEMKCSSAKEDVPQFEGPPPGWKEDGTASG